MSAAQLLPCPFCGGDAKLHDNADAQRTQGNDPDSFYPQCEGCQALLLNDPETDYYFDSAAGAIAAWNRRASDPARVRNEVLEAVAAYFLKQPLGREWFTDEIIDAIYAMKAEGVDAGPPSEASTNPLSRALKEKPHG